MRPPVLRWSDGGHRLGLWQSQTRRLSIARGLVRDHSWLVVVEVLKHEMAHQYVSEVLKVTDETAHGPRFREVCAARGIDAGSRGLPTPRQALSEDEARTIRRIQRLLALAESPNVHEAQSAMNAAQRLMLRANIAATPSRYAFRQIGRARKRIPQHVHLLAGLLAQHFFIEVLWTWIYDAAAEREAKVLELCGTHANLEMASYVHAFLLQTGERLWQAHKQARRLTSDRDRRRFLSGMMIGFGEKLAEQAQRNQQEGLVWVGDADLRAYFHARHPRTRSGGRMKMTMNQAWLDGQAAGREIVLNRPMGAAATNRGRQIEG